MTDIIGVGVKDGARMFVWNEVVVWNENEPLIVNSSKVIQTSSRAAARGNPNKLPAKKKYSSVNKSRVALLTMLVL